jgi:hypothetical protein
MSRIIEFLKRHKTIVASFVAIVALTACVELSMGRSFLGPDGKFGWWDGNIWGSENSQRVADAYSFSHIVHGILFFAFLWLVARSMPLRWRFLIAVLMEAGWEVLENSPLIINRYREATIALGYVGDSVLNSCCDILMMALGFAFAFRARVSASVLAILVMEIGCLIWIRDNLALNVIMLIHPIDAIKVWQSTGQPLP